MKKSDLKTGMRVELRDGSLYLVIKDIDSLNYGHQDIAFVNKGFFNGAEFENDLTHKNFKDLDIMKVFNSDIDNVQLVGCLLDLNVKYLIWKRQEYTDRQKEIFKALKVLGFNWIAEDECGCIFVYENKPTKNLELDIWDDESGTHLEIYIDRIMNHLDFIDWEDEEPFEIPAL